MKRPFPISLLTVVISASLAWGADSAALPRSSPEKQGVCSIAILDFLEAADQLDTMNSFMLVRHGHVVSEGWWTPYDASLPHTLFSLSKSFTSTAVGLAVSEGKMSLDDEVIKFFPEDAPGEPSENLKQMRVRDLLCMSAGHQQEAFPVGEERWTKLFLHHPVPHKPGTHFLYNTPATYMLSAIVQKVTGTTVLDYLKPRLFDPLGIKDPAWGVSPQGITLGGYGLDLRTEEIARFGQLYLQKGEWQGKSLIPASWVELASSRQTSNGSNPASDWEQGYGFQFWRCRHGAYRGDGAFGQYCIVMPEQDAVVAITSGVRNMQAVMNLVWEKLLPAMRSAPLPDNSRSQALLGKKLAGLAVQPAAGKPTSELAGAVSGKRFLFPDNERNIREISLAFAGETATLTVRTTDGENRINCGHGAWQKGRSSFVNGSGRPLLPAGDHAVAATGAWTEEDTYVVKMCLYETPFYVSLVFRFKGNRLFFDSEYNVAFGPTKLPQLVGQTNP
jgi:CubicO group peptidase (beta-lactamase class C family)